MQKLYETIKIVNYKKNRKCLRKINILFCFRKVSKFIIDWRISEWKLLKKLIRIYFQKNQTLYIFFEIWTKKNSGKIAFLNHREKTKINDACRKIVGINFLFEAKFH